MCVRLLVESFVAAPLDGAGVDALEVMLALADIRLPFRLISRATIELPKR